ncbi:MAG: ABC transporter permease, partial [Bacteroidota bacterium]
MSRFDLEHALATWRHHLRLERALLPEDLDELEDHLRHHIDALQAEGLGAQAAFERALRHLGTAGDLTPEYRKVRYGRTKRRRSLLRAQLWHTIMLKNYLTTALRSVRRQKGFVAINLVGLAVGLAGSLLIGLYVTDELSYDRFHAHGDRIYRLGSATVGWPYGRILEAEYPEVEEVVYLRTYPTFSIQHGGQRVYETMRYAEASFFDVFDFPLLEGDPETALAEPFSLVLSDALAQKYFGAEPALGQTLVLSDSLQFTVRGVAQVPRTSHIQFDALLSFETLRALYPGMVEENMAEGWLNVNVITYVLLHEGTDAETFAAKIRDLPQERAGAYLSQWGSSYPLDLEPLGRLYLHSEAGNWLGPKSTIDYVYLLGMVGLILLLIAAVNFVNLTTARSAERAKEVGIRKVVGSDRGALVGQFLAESLAMCGVAVVLALGMAWLALPFFNELAGKSFTGGHLVAPGVLGAVLGLAAGVGLLAGLYPAAVLSAFRPVAVLKGRFATGQRGVRLRRGLVVVQFALSGVLIMATLVVLDQLQYMQRQDLGFDDEQVLVLDARQAPGADLVERSEGLQQALAAHAAVTEVSAMWAVPGRNGWRGQLSFPEDWPEGESISLEYIGVDYGFAEALGLRFVAGRSFDPAFRTDAATAVIINEAAVAEAGWGSAEDAIGKGFTSPGSGKPDGVVIGVVEDYHHHGLQQRIEPIMFGLRTGNGLLTLRVDAADAEAVIDHAQATWSSFFPTYTAETF